MSELGVRQAAIALSLAVHAVVFWYYGDSLWERNHAAPDLPSIVAQLSVAPPALSPAAPSPVVQEVIQKPEPLPKAAPQPALAKRQEAMQAPTAKAEALRPVPEVQKNDEPIPPVEVEKAQREVVMETAAITEPAPIATEAAESAPSPRPVQEAATLIHAQADQEKAARELQRYLAALRASIVANKDYPAIARRRGMEGKVNVSFLLLANGDIRELRVSGGPRPLRLAAKRAVDKALLFPSPPAHATIPLPVQYAMSFTLQ